MTPEEENDLRRRQAALSALFNNPAWPTFVEEAKRKVEKLQRRALHLALSADGADQRELDEIRGYINGLDWVTRTPEVAEARLAKFMARVERTRNAA